MKDFKELDAELINLMPKLKRKTDTRSEIFAGIVFSRRIKNGLSQQQLADKAEVDIKNIHRIEGGTAILTKQFMKKFSRL